MPETTTIQIGKDVAGALKTISGGGTYDEAVRKLLLTSYRPAASIPFKKTVPSLEIESEEHRIPHDGIVTRVVMHFPPGCSSLVDVRLLYIEDGKEYYVVPSIEDKFIALDAATPVYEPKFPVKQGKILKVEWYNYDDTYEHTISVSAEITPKIV